jgi:hypothetical protein
MLTAAIKTLLLGLPETIGLFVFGVGLVVIAVLIRWVLRRNDETSGA